MTTKNQPIIELSAADLPAVCPNKSIQNWNSHPKVSLDISHGNATCPYCGTVYRLKAGEQVKSH